MIPSNGKKRPRRSLGSPSSVSSTVAALIDSNFDNSVVEASQKLRRSSSQSVITSSNCIAGTSIYRSTISFHDASTADVILRLVSEEDADDETKGVQIHLHSWALQRSDYFAVRLSDRWQSDDPCSARQDTSSLILPICSYKGSIESYLMVFKLLYHPKDGTDSGFPIESTSSALDLLPAALHILFEDLVRFCVRFLEAVPWTEEEELRVLALIPLLSDSESEVLLARMSPKNSSPSEDMLHGLISQAVHNYPSAASAKNFVAVLLRDLSSREAARVALERTFAEILRAVRESLEEYSSPDFRGYHNETEAKQKANLQTLFTNGRHLCWVVERMVELKVADKAVREWSEQPGFTADLERALREDAWRDIVPGLPSVLLRCTSKIATAVASGSILAPQQVRLQLVKHWVPVLALCKENGTSSFPVPRILFAEVEETFLKIISTLPLSDSQQLLQQCLGFSTRSVDDCQHLLLAFETWFRRATRSLPSKNSR